MTDINTEDVIAVVPVRSLDFTVTEPGVKIVWLHQYTYAGEKREKIKELSDIKRVHHTSSSSRGVVEVYGRPSSTAYLEWHTFKDINQTVMIVRNA